MKQFLSEVVSIKEIARDYFQLDFHWNIREIPQAGQFLTIRITDLVSPLLRRPFALSAFSRATDTASIIFQKVGKGTELLSRLSKGDSLDILAPLGNSFAQAVSIQEWEKPEPVIVAGGIGMGPMLYLAQELIYEGKSPELVIGCRDKSLIPFDAISDEMKPVICTDDGSYGFKGNVVDYLQSGDLNSRKTVLFACGPEPMLKSCVRFAAKNRIESYVSLEQMMACGIGACMGCTCEKTGEQNYARVCKDGPVFRGEDIKWT